MLPVELLAKQLAVHGNMPTILAAEAWLDSMGGRDQELPVQHFFLDGVYIRVLKIPYGTALSGIIHKQEKLTIVTKGRLTLMDQEKTIEVAAPYYEQDAKGIKRFIVSHADSELVNIFRTDETDKETILETLGSVTIEDYAQFLLTNQRGK